STRSWYRVEPQVMKVVLGAAAVAVLGFVLVVVSVIVSFRIGRGLVRDLTRLRKDAHEVSGVRLPAVMRRLAAGETVDVETEAPRLEYGQDEMGQVGQALNTLQRAAVEAAVKQSDMRRGVSEVFVNLARRNQVLLHRQLTLLDAMERRTEDTDELADLFKLDHLTTRMRRHAEGLVILSGAAPSRQWRRPIQLMDVVRAAVAEVEDYERIEVRRLPRLAVNGPAVADLTHLVAELLENATVFSPPHTAVQVLGGRAANGFTLEIHDRGLGMAPEALLDANLRLAETPEFELSDTDRLGLFVVSRLAQRLGVRVSLQTSPYGGVTAVVFIPATLLTEKPSGTLGDASETSGSTGEIAAPAGGRMAALAQVPVPLSGAPSQPVPALDGPVELEAPVDPLETGEDDDEGGIFRSRKRIARRPGPAPVPAAEQHQQADDDVSAGHAGTDGGPAEPSSLPRRRPLLVSDHGRPVDTAGRRGAEPGGGRPRPEDDGGPRPLGGLPRRVRQASLAPQLKEEPAQRAEQQRPADPEPERDAEEVRSRMASLQRGWQRGRAHSGDDTGTAGDTAPGTTSEGDGR
ncbi:ATP-binding protein, partial [Streptomyces sp. NPDC048845]|uniref:ATP-binding protein n=1 Tax=Streptomyces sp. NPDC048845 TaxID=3155390 RepID=UPI00343902D1